MRKGWLSDYERMRPLDGLPPMARGSIDTCVPSDEEKRRKAADDYSESKKIIADRVRKMREEREKESRARLDAKRTAELRTAMAEYQKQINEAQVFVWDGENLKPQVLAK
jgi:fumarylacetoacetate (FAA) hydrolase family protein